MNKVCVVTCNRDRLQFRIQCWSIGQYLQPVELHIIINEHLAADWLAWYQQNCATYLKRHSVHVYSPHDIVANCVHTSMVQSLIYKAPGWHSQQILKLLAGYQIKSSYTVLDTKNWFIKPCSIDQFKPQQRTWNHHNKSFDAFYNDCLLRLDLVPGISYRPHVTPFHFDAITIDSMIKYFGGVDQFCCWFLSFAVPSEFIVYDLFVQQQGFETDNTSNCNFNCGYWFQQPGVTGLFSDQSVDLIKIQAILNSTKHYMLSLQPALLANCNISVLEATIGFTK